jgi:hypothetical protein
MARLKLLLVLALLGASAAHADPVSIIGGIMAMAGASAAGVTLSAIAFAGISYGSLAFAAGSLIFGTLNAKRKQKKAEASARNQYNSNLQDRLVTALSTASPWQIVYGQAEVGGSLEAILTSGAKDEFKHLVIVFAAHECQEFVDIKIAGESLGALDGNGYVTSGKWFKSETQTYSETVVFDAGGQGTITRANATLLKVIQPRTGVTDSFDGTPEVLFEAAALVGTTVSGGPVSESAMVTYTTIDDAALVRVQKHLGADDQLADATLVAECGDEWSADDRLRGLCYLVVRLNLTEPEFQGGPPAITVKLKGKKIYDHRTGLTAWSENAALCVVDYLRAPYGKDARDNQIVWATADAAANACDEPITDGGAGTMPRFTCNGSFSTGQGTDETLEDLLAAMAGWADCSGGWRIGAGVWTAPVTTITNDDNAGPVQIVGGLALDELYNGMRGQFNDPERFGVATDFPPYQNTAFVAADGDRDLWADLNLSFTNSAQRATNLARIFTEQARGETISYPAKLAVVNRVKVGERLLLENPILGINGVAFRLVKRDENPGGALLLTLQQDVEGNYDLADAVAPIPSSTNALPDPYAVPAVTGLAASSGEQYALVTSTSVIPRVKITVTGQAQFLTDQLQLEWRTSDTDDWQALTVPAGQQAAYIENVNQGVTYFVRARWYRPSVGAAGDWRVVSVTVTGKTTAPPAFDVFTVTQLADGTRRYAFGYAATAQPVDWKGAEIRYLAGTHAAPDWDTMTRLNAIGQVFAASPVDSNLPAAGTWTFACRSRDSGGLSTAIIVNATLTAAPAWGGLDTTAPPTPTGFAVSAALANIFAEHAAPAYTEGHGHAKTRLYGKKYTGGALPVFADASLLAEFTGSIYAYPSSLGTTWRLWIKWVSADGVESVVPAGGANGLAATTGVIGNADLGPLIIEAGQLADSAVTAVKIDDEAITAPKMAANAIAVGTAAVQNGAIVNAMIANLAVDSAKIANAAVTNAKIGALAVDTLNIAGNAVTIPVSVSASSGVNMLAGGEQTVATLPTFTSKGGPVIINFGAVVSVDALDMVATMRVKRNGSTIFSASFVVPFSLLSLPPVSDTPGNGTSTTYTVTYDLTFAGSATTASMTNRAAVALETIK